MKKNSIQNKLLIVLLMFIPFIVEASSSYGQLRYEVTNLSINGKEIEISGWALIYETQNTASNENIGTTDNTKIYIRAVNKNNNEIVYAETKDISSDSSEGKNAAGNKTNYRWNFFEEMYWEYLNANRNWPIQKQLETVYNGKEFTIDWGKSSTTWKNTCDYSKEKTNLATQCYYENIGFTAKFDVEDWNIEDEEEVVLQIKMSNSSVETEWTSIGITNAAMPAITKSDYIEIVKESVSNEVKCMVDDGRFTDGSDNLIEENGKYIIMKKNANYTLVRNGYITPKKNKYPGESKYDGYPSYQTTYGSGKYAVYVDKKVTDNGEYNPAEKGDYLFVSTSWVKPSGTFDFKVKNSKKCDVSEPKKDKLSCNNSKTLKSDCNVLTVREHNTAKDYSLSAEVEIHQEGTISSVLTPDKTFSKAELDKKYSGGGFKLGIIYNNEVSWKYNKLRCETIKKQEKCSNSKEILNKLMQKRLTKDFEENLKLQSIKFGKDTIEFSKFNKKCYTSGAFKNDETLKTTCIITLPTPNMDKFTGNVTYSNTGKPNINNKYYTPVTWEGTYPIEMTIVGLNRLDTVQAERDTKVKGKIWTGTWEETFNNCSIKLYPLIKKHEGSIPKEEETITNNFIYRPINIYEPFPNNRMPGINWYDWWLGDNSKSNQRRLKQTYSNLQYSIELDNTKINRIKSYNSDIRNNGSYLEWKDINDKGESKFIEKYFNTYRENIVGDSK